MLRSCRGLAPVALVLLSSCSDRPPAEPIESEATVEVLVRGSHFRGTNGIHFGPDGLLYVASVVTPALAAIDPESGEIKTQWGAAEGAKGPDDLAFGPDGSVYWTTSSSATWSAAARRHHHGDREPGPGVNPITFSDDGRLFVSQCFLGDKLFEIDPAGAKPPRVISDQLGPGCGLNGMDWGPDDKLYGPRWFQGKVARVDVDSGQVETVAEGFGVPAAVKFDSKGRLHVLDSLRGEIVRVDLDAGTREVVGKVPPSTADNLALMPRIACSSRASATASSSRCSMPSARARCSPAASARRAVSRWRAAAPARPRSSTSPTSSRCAGSIRRTEKRSTPRTTSSASRRSAAR